MKKIVKAALASAGWELGRTADLQAQALADLSAADREIVSRVHPFTCLLYTSPSPRDS